MSKHPIFTWGYGLLTGQADIDDIMTERGVSEFTLVDVRCTRGSRNKAWDFSQRTDIYGMFRYEHIPLFGNHGKGRKWERPLNCDRIWLALSAYARRIQDGEVIVLMCCETDPKRCHRVEVAEAIAERVPGGAKVVNL